MRLIAFSVVGFAVVAALGAGVYALRLPSVTIHTVTVSDGDFVDTRAVQGTVTDMLAGSYAFLIPRTFALSYPRTSIVAAIRSSFPAVKDVTVERRGLTALTVALTERVPVARWCSGTCYFMDEGGMIFAPADSVSGLVYEGPIEGDPVGQAYLDGEFPALAGFVARLDVATGLTPLSVSVDATDDVAVTFAEGGSMRFSRMQDLASLEDSIRTTFASKQFAAHQALDYVDFRFGSSVYVKWK